MIMAHEPDIGKKPGPTAVAIQERMNLDGSVMKSHGLHKGKRLVLLPKSQIIQKGLELQRYLMPVTADVEILHAEFTSPTPNLSEHLLVQAHGPPHRERSSAPARLRGEVLHDSLADVLGFVLIER
jgi:hypothetical protein